MNFDAIFTAYYTQYRAEQTPPASTDPEYTIALRFANDAIHRWANYDGVYWKELHATDTSKTVLAATTTYAAPTNFKEAGGFVKLKNSDGKTVSRIPIVEPQEAQFKNENSSFCYFTGSPVSGYSLELNRTPSASDVGLTIEYNYYKKPTDFAIGTSITEVPIPDFIIYHMLAHRFRASRNWSAYQTAKRDAEDLLKIMQMDNNSGSWANPWKLADNSGSSWGA